MGSLESGVRLLFTDGTIIGTKVMMMVRSTSQKSGNMMERTRMEKVRIGRRLPFGNIAPRHLEPFHHEF